MGAHKNDTSHFVMKIGKSFKHLAHLFFILSNLLLFIYGNYMKSEILLICLISLGCTNSHIKNEEVSEKN